MVYLALTLVLLAVLWLTICVASLRRDVRGLLEREEQRDMNGVIIRRLATVPYK